MRLAEISHFTELPLAMYAEDLQHAHIRCDAAEADADILQCSILASRQSTQAACALRDHAHHAEHALSLPGIVLAPGHQNWA